MLSFEIKNSEPSSVDELEIYCDPAGLQSLLSQLRLLDDGRTDHIHLMAESWGGSHLAEEVHRPENKAIRHVKVVVTPRRS